MRIKHKIVTRHTSLNTGDDVWYNNRWVRISRITVDGKIGLGERSWIYPQTINCSWIHRSDLYNQPQQVNTDNQNREYRVAMNTETAELIVNILEALSFDCAPLDDFVRMEDKIKRVSSQLEKQISQFSNDDINLIQQRKL